MSTATLDRGLSLVRGATMSLSSDPLYAEMLVERERLLVSCQMCVKFFFSVWQVLVAILHFIDLKSWIAVLVAFMVQSGFEGQSGQQGCEAS